jgi:hypothetical protein
VGRGWMSDNGVRGWGYYDGLSLGENAMSCWRVNSEMLCILTCLGNGLRVFCLWGCNSPTIQNGAVWEIHSIPMYHTKDTPCDQEEFLSEVGTLWG